MYIEDLKRALSTLGPRLWQAYGQGKRPARQLSAAYMHLDNGDGRLDERLLLGRHCPNGRFVRVVDAAGNDVPPGENGEVIVAGDVVMAGYWNNPSATAQALRNGWLWTGDVGTFDGPRVPLPQGSIQGRYHLRRLQHLSTRGRGGAAAPSCRDRVSFIGRQHPDGARRLLPS